MVSCAGGRRPRPGNRHANPVEAMAVRYAKDWPGAQTLPRDIGTRELDYGTELAQQRLA